MSLRRILAGLGVVVVGLVTVLIICSLGGSVPIPSADDAEAHVTEFSEWSARLAAGGNFILRGELPPASAAELTEQSESEGVRITTLGPLDGDALAIALSDLRGNYEAAEANLTKFRLEIDRATASLTDLSKEAELMWDVERFGAAYRLFEDGRYLTMRSNGDDGIPELPDHVTFVRFHSPSYTVGNAVANIVVLMDLEEQVNLANAIEYSETTLRAVIDERIREFNALNFEERQREYAEFRRDPVRFPRNVLVDTETFLMSLRNRQ